MVDKELINTGIILVDLDGTIVNERINNTFDFLREYLRYRYKIVGIIRYKLAVMFISLISNLTKNEIFLRNLSITLCVIGVNIRDFVKFAVKCWLPYVLRNINVDVLNFIRKLEHKGYTPIMLTACIEVPATLISKYLGFKMCIATKLRFFGPLIIGISEDTYGHLKFASASRLLGFKQVQQAIYIADEASIAAEKAALYVNKIYSVNKMDNTPSLMWHV